MRGIQGRSFRLGELVGREMSTGTVETEDEVMKGKRRKMCMIL
jgi:hypothetical protein